MSGTLWKALLPAALAVMVTAGDAPALLFGDGHNKSEGVQFVWEGSFRTDTTHRNTSFPIRKRRAPGGVEFGCMGGSDAIIGPSVSRCAFNSFLDAAPHAGSKRADFEVAFTSNDHSCQAIVLDDNLVNPDAFVASDYYRGAPGRVSGDFPFEISTDALAQIPEPPAMMLLGAGLVAVAGMVRRKILRTEN
ncbi:MAG: PEP-CTERM sorting domain-containing protein [Desulfobulbaceae bacterium]|nr:PEP-CTERM sorting domain-containing protein [Desulfobulbaceae bacterium]